MAGVFIAKRASQDPAAKVPRQLADQLLQGWQSCNFDTYMRAKHHAIYKDIKEKVESGPDKLEFDETCGKIEVLTLLREEKSKKTDSAGAAGYRFDYKLKQSMSDSYNEIVVLPIIVVGDEKDGFLVTAQAFLNEENYTGAQTKAVPKPVSSQDKDEERKADRKALQDQLNDYFEAHRSQYPTLNNLNDPAWRTKNLTNLTEALLKDPEGKEATLVAGGAQKNAYTYNYYYGSKHCGTKPSGCTLHLHIYDLSAILEDGSKHTVYGKSYEARSEFGL